MDAAAGYVREVNRGEAAELVGRRVQAWTATNGVYTGTLVEVTADRPWRGRVLIDGVLEPALAWDARRHGAPRRGFRPGETVEVGCLSVSVCQKQGSSYRQALVRDIERLRKLKASNSGRDAWWIERAITVREQQLTSEPA